LARWKDKHGKTQTALLSEDEKSIVLEYRCWYIAYTDGGGARRTVKGYTDRTATEAEAAKLE